MSLISWEKIVKGVLPNPPIPKSPHSASTHTRTISILRASVLELRVPLSPASLRIIKYTSITADRYTSGWKGEGEGN